MATETKTILVIDDEPAIRDFVRFALEGVGYAVLEAENGRKGIEEFERNHVDVIITDLVMPEKEGLETIIKLKADRSDLKIIAISGVANSDMYLKMAGGLGAHETLQKPFNKNQVLQTLRKVLER